MIRRPAPDAAGSPDAYGPHGPYGPADPYWRARAALVVPVLAADRVVDRHRWRLDPSAARGLAAHVSLVSPFLPREVPEGEVVERLAAAFAPAPPFRAVFDQVRWFDDEAIWLAAVPEDPFADLMRRARAAVTCEEPEPGVPTVPHLVVGYRRHSSVDELRIAAHQLGPELPVAAAVDHVALVSADGPSARWRTVATFPLGAVAAASPG